MTEAGPGLAGVRLATAADESAITALTSSVGFDGAVRLALSRGAAANALEGIRHASIVATGSAGRIVACATRITKTVVCRGQPALLGYLGSLRAQPQGAAGAWLRSGFSLVDALREADELPFDLTSIGTDNAGALRLLTAGARGLPHYLPWIDYETMLLPVPRRIAQASPTHASGSLPMPGVLSALQSHANHSVLAEHWTEERLQDARRMTGLRRWLVRDRAVAGLWDLSACKQARVLGYRGGLRAMRRLLGFLPGLSRLPDVGQVLAIGYLAPSGWTDDDAMLDLICDGVGAAFGLSWLVFGAARDSRLASLVRRRFPHAPRWGSRLFLVVAPGSAGEAEAKSLIRSGQPRLEVALL